MKRIFFLITFICSVAIAGQYLDKLNVDNVQIDGNTISTTNTNGNLTFDMNGTGSVILTDLTANKVLYLDSSKKVASSSADADDLGNIAGLGSPACGESDTCTLTNKTMSGASNTFSNIADTSLSTISTSGKVSNSATTATSANTNSAIVARDGSGNFSAGTITANLTGNVTGNLTGAVTGNASTASALAANPADCSAGQLATTIAANGDLTCTATPTLGVAGSTLGTLALTGNTSGTITIKPQAAAGTYNFNLPTTAGNSGDVLTSGGGGSTAMTWSTPLANPMDGQGQLIYGGVAGAVTKLAAGSSGQYLESSGASAPTWKSIPRSRIRVETGNGFGSTNTRIRRFSTSVVSTGSDITYADSATNGATFTLGSAGIYSATTCDYKAAGFCNSGISINSAQLTTNIESITNTARLGLQSQSGEISCVTATFIGAASDVIRAHGDNRCDGADAYVNFDIIKISN